MSEHKMSEWDRLHSYFSANGCLELTVRSAEPFDVKKHLADWLAQRDRERDAVIVEECAAVLEQRLALYQTFTAVREALTDARNMVRSLRPDASRLLELVKLKAKLEENLPNSLRWNDLKLQIEQKEKELAEGSKTV